MDLARPRGVVLDAGFGLNLLPSPVADLFHDDSAILKGILPNVPLPVHCWPDEVVVPDWQKRPLDESRWEHEEAFPTVTPQGRKGRGTRYLPIPVEVSSALGKQYAEFSIKDLIAEMERRNVKPNWQLTIKVSYQIR